MSSDTNFFDSTDSSEVQNTTSDFDNYFVKTSYDEIENTDPDLTPTKSRIEIEMAKLKDNFEDSEITPTKTSIEKTKKEKIDVKKIKNEMKEELNKKQMENIKENIKDRLNKKTKKNEINIIHSKNVVIKAKSDYKGYDAIITDIKPVTYKIKLSNETDKKFIKRQYVLKKDLYTSNSDNNKTNKILDMREKNIDITSPNYKILQTIPVLYSLKFNNNDYRLPANEFTRLIKYNGKYGFYDKKIKTCSVFGDDIEQISNDFIHRKMVPTNTICEEDNIENTEYYIYTNLNNNFGVYGKIDKVIDEQCLVELHDEITLKQNHFEYTDKKNIVKIKIGIYKGIIGKIILKNDKSFSIYVDAIGKDISLLNDKPITDETLFFKDVLLKQGKYAQLTSINNNEYEGISLSNGSKILFSDKDIESIDYEVSKGKIHKDYNNIKNDDELDFIFEPEPKLREDDGTFDSDDENTGDYEEPENDKDEQQQQFNSSYKDIERTSLTLEETEEIKNIKTILKLLIKKLNLDDTYINDYEFITDIDNYLNNIKKNAKKWDNENDKFIILSFLLSKTENMDSKATIQKLLKEKFFKSTKDINKLFDKFENFSKGIYTDNKNTTNNISHFNHIVKVKNINIDDYIRRSSFSNYDFSALEKISWYNYTHILQTFKNTLLTRYTGNTCNDKTKDVLQYVYSNIESAPVILNNKNLKNKKKYVWLEKAWISITQKVTDEIKSKSSKIIISKSNKDITDINNSMFYKYLKINPETTLTNSKTMVEYKKSSIDTPLEIDDEEYKKLEKKSNKLLKKQQKDKRAINSRFNSMLKQEEEIEADVPSDTEEEFDKLLKWVKEEEKKKRL